MDKWRKFLLSMTATLEDAVAILEQNQCAVVVDEQSRLAGTLTDRDVRRALLKHHAMDSPVLESMNATPTFLSYPLDVTQARVVHQQKGFEQYPIVDEFRVVRGLYTHQELLKDKLTNPVILMAGGIGSRLAPLTNECPKPLLKIGQRPILETILLELIQFGFENFWISVNYQAEMIEKFFGDGKSWNVQIQYLREQEPLGTVGSLKLLPEQFFEPALVMNGDLLTKLNYHQMFVFHEYHKAQITVGVKEHDLKVPYGVVDMEDVRVVKLEEKPVHRFFVNAGIYVLEPEIIQMIPNSHFNMTDLLTKIMPEGKVVAFPVHEYWIDIGQFEDFQRANADYDKVFLTGK